MNPVAQIRSVRDGDIQYEAIVFVCPGCKQMWETGNSGLHMLPVNSSVKTPQWSWDGNLEAPTLSPSVLTRYGDRVCHSFIKNGVVEFLSDCSHALAGQSVPLPPLEDWMVKEAGE